MRTTRLPQTQIYSIFGQIEEVVANAMVDEGKLNKIEAKDIPRDAAFREGDNAPAKFAVVVPREHAHEFEKRIADLRA